MFSDKIGWASVWTGESAKHGKYRSTKKWKSEK